MERTAAELDKIRQKNVETSGGVNPNSQLDFMLTSEIISYAELAEEVDAVLTTVTTHKCKLVVSVKFTDVHTGQIVVSETYTKELKGEKMRGEVCAKALADELSATIVT